MFFIPLLYKTNKIRPREMPSTLHILGLPHTVVNNEYSTCAFTGKVLRFSRMMQAYGWRVVEYSNEGSQSGADEHVCMLSATELKTMTQRKSQEELYHVDIYNTVLTTLFSERLCTALATHAKPGDIVCHVFGPDMRAVNASPHALHVESGIGYTCIDNALPHRVFESAYWMAWHSGKRSMTMGSNVEFVAPNYYDIAEWPIHIDDAGDKNNAGDTGRWSTTVDTGRWSAIVDTDRLRDSIETGTTVNAYILVFCRLIAVKGLNILVEIAKRMPGTTFVICGQGDPSQWLTSPNISYHPPVVGKNRASLLGKAAAVLCASEFIEPFCGTAVEAQLCGTPVISSNFGAFHETIEDGVTGFRCHTLGDYMRAVKDVSGLDRAVIAARARRLYSLETVGATYNTIFTYLQNQMRDGWYTTEIVS